MTRRSARVLALLLAVLLVVPSVAAAATPLLSRVAERSVAAVQGQGGSSTAFAYGHEGGLFAASGSGPIHAVTGSGVAITGEPTSSRDGVSVAHVSALPLTALLATTASSVSVRAAKYVLGPPLGYEGGHIRSVRMPTVHLTGTTTQRISGVLPGKFLGAPVVTAHGRLIGSVASVGPRSWEFAPLGMLNELAVVHSSSGVPVLAIVLGALIIFAGGAVFGVLRMKRRRDRELDLRMRQDRARGAAERRAEGPLVRLRTPDDAVEQDTEEHFDVIIKPRTPDS